MPPRDIPDPNPATNSGEDTSAQSLTPDEVQLSRPDGVSTDVSSVAIDRGLLHGGLARGSRAYAERPTEHGMPDAASSDASIRTNSAGTDPDVGAMLRVKAGDESAFGFLIQKYRRPMVGFMFRFCHNPAAAEELAQEVFLRVYRSRTSYEPSAKFTTWLYRIATNLAVNHARDTRHERPENTVRLDEQDEETGTTPDLADETPGAEARILKRERLAAIRSRVNALPERQRVAVIMHKYQEMDYREIATVLKLSESATKSLLFRAYETLREQLKEFVEGN
jgi:RNA polymerase sigma-70 factor (ECF subfamily)